MRDAEALGVLSRLGEGVSRRLGVGLAKRQPA
jgi:hypothetical protein